MFDPYDDRYDPDQGGYEPWDSFDAEADTPTHEVVFADNGSHVAYVYPGEPATVGYRYQLETGREVIVRRF